jgi:hypothetical protein
MARVQRAFLFLDYAMFLTRFFLWQYFYQMLYAMNPIMTLAWWFGRNAKMSAASARNQRRTMA